MLYSARFILHLTVLVAQMVAHRYISLFVGCWNIDDSLVGQLTTQMVQRLYLTTDQYSYTISENEFLACLTSGKWKKISKKYHRLNKEGQGRMRWWARRSMGDWFDVLLTWIAIIDCRDTVLSLSHRKSEFLKPPTLQHSLSLLWQVRKKITIPTWR